MTFSLDSDIRTSVVSFIIAEYPDEAMDDEWLVIYWSERLDYYERCAFGSDFSIFQVAVTEALAR